MNRHSSTQDTRSASSFDGTDPGRAPYYHMAKPVSGKEQLEQVLDLLVRRKWSIILWFLLIAGAVAAYTFTRTPQYQANAIVMVDLAQPGPIAGEVSVGMAGNELANRAGGRSLNTELFVLENSFTISRRVQEQLRGDQGETYQQRGRVSFQQADRSVSNAIRVSATSPEPAEAEKLANTYADEYVRLTQESSRTHLSAQRTFLEEQQQQRLEELRQAEEKVKAYMMREGAVGLDQESSYLVTQIAGLEASRDDARIELQMRQASLESVEREIENLNPQLVQMFSSRVESQMQAVQEQLSALERQKNQILLSNPAQTERTEEELASIDSKIQRLQGELNQLSQEFVDNGLSAGSVQGGEGGLAYVAELKQRAMQERIQIDGIKSRMQIMNQRLQEHQGELNDIPELSLELARLERERQHAEQMYQYVVQRLQQALVAEESEPGYAQVLRKATTPRAPVYPDIPRNLVLGLFFGLFVGIAWAIGRDKLDNRVYKPDELRKQGYSVIGVIPDMQPFIKEDYSGKEYVEQNGKQFATSLLALLNPMSSVTEAFRHVRTSIQFCLPDTLVQTLLVTSSGADEGKSTTAANLALVVAQSGRRTLLIDADLRRPRQHKLFGVDREPGLADALFQKTQVDTSVFATDVEGLYVMPSGKVTTNPSELLGSKRLRELLRSLRNEFDMIILDTPPVLAATDPVLLSTQCDATLLVARSGKTKEGELEFSRDALQDVGATIIGTLLNGFNISDAYSYKYRYRSYTKYGYQSKYGYAQRSDR